MRLGKANESDREGDGGEREKDKRKRRWEERERQRGQARNERREAKGREGVVKEERVWWGCPCSSPARDLHFP